MNAREKMLGSDALKTKEFIGIYVASRKVVADTLRGLNCTKNPIILLWTTTTPGRMVRVELESISIQ